MISFDEFGLKIPEILLPSEIDLKTWSVIACDQFTQDAGYWKNAADAAGDRPSTLNLILPEVYLGASDRKERIEKIRSNMNSYIESGVFAPAESEFIYVERTTPYGRTRKGLVAAIDLDSYEWKPFSKALIRATEATIVDRIPPRKEIRKNAPLELPHIMLLVNDPGKTLVEKAGELAKKRTPRYEGELMLGSGKISGWAVSEEEELSSIRNSLEGLKKAGTAADGSSFLFAVGDGNHSLATAKAVWDEYREELRKAGASEEEIASSPVRHALVEIVNLYDDGLTFEPIHRVVFGSNPDDLIGYVADRLGGKTVLYETADELVKDVSSSKANFGFVFTSQDKTLYYCVQTKLTDLAVACLQPELDNFLKYTPACEIDYIHGTDEVLRLGKMEHSVSVMLPPIAKDSFFETIGGRGPLPRKSFSMGEASEKRFYLECRRLFDR